MRVLLVVGTRPEAIKLAPVVLAARTDPEVECVLVSTGQHRAMLDQALATFGLVPDHDLGALRPGDDLCRLTARLLGALGPVVAGEDPDVVVVQGDTTTALSAAMAGFSHATPVAHVEAGLRTGDPRHPFPEEMNRRLIGRLATCHLAPTAGAQANLLVEGVPAERVLVTGNTVVDALGHVLARPCPYGDPRLDALDTWAGPVVVVTAHRRESWGAGLGAVAGAVARLARQRPEVRVVVPVHGNPVVRAGLVPALAGVANVILTGPLAYGAFARLLRRAAVVLTDSGGVQEEAPCLGTPVLVTRAVTERPEGVVAGLCRLVGTDEATIVAALHEAITAGRPGMAASPYGDGRAAGRVLDALRHFLAGGPAPEPFVAPGPARLRAGARPRLRAGPT